MGYTMNESESLVLVPTDEEVATITRNFKAHEDQAAREVLLREYHARLKATQDFVAFISRMFADIFPTDQTGFIMGEHLLKVATILNTFRDAVEQGKDPRLMIFLPPRTGKTTFIASFFAWMIGHHSNWEYILCSFSEDRARDLGNMLHRYFQNPLFKEMFPDFALSSKSSSAERAEFKKGGAMTCGSPSSGLNGRGGKVLWLDDAHKDEASADSDADRNHVNQWVMSTFLRRQVPTGAGVLVTQTRWREDDAPGMLLQIARENPDADQWMVYSFPAIENEWTDNEKSFFPERFPLEKLKRWRAGMMVKQPRSWSALYQQNPLPAQGVHIKASWFDRCLAPESDFPAKSATTNALTIDFAVSDGTGNHTALFPVGFDCNDVCWVRPDHFFKQADPKETLEQIEKLLRRYEPTYFFVEKGPIWRSLGSTVRNVVFRNARCYPKIMEISRGKKNKREVASPYINALESGLLRYPNTEFTKGVLIPQHLAFGASSSDDIVDALALPFVERGSIILPGKEVDLPEIKESSYQDNVNDFIRQRAFQKEDDEEADPYPLFAGDRRA
jgi:hypothetical protein